MSARTTIFVAGLVGLIGFLVSRPAIAAGGPLSIAQVKAMAGRTVRLYAPSVDPMMIRAMVEIESARDPLAFRAEPHIGDASIGLMQTLEGTAQWLWDDMGARAFARPTLATLTDPATSMYFGARYIVHLQGHPWNRGTEEWIVRAYNGGPGGATSTATLEHWRRYERAKARLIAGDQGGG